MATELLKKIKDKNKNIPVVLISARGECIDRVLGLKWVGRIILAKPFLPAELCYRVSICLKAIICPPEKLIKFNSYYLDKSKREIYTEQQIQISVTSKEFDIILYFFNAPFSCHITRSASYRYLGRKLLWLLSCSR